MQVLTNKYLLAALIACSFMGGFLLLYYFNPAKGGYFLQCPFHFATGLYCPGCGSQRALHQLFHLNFNEAFRYNPLMVLSLPLVAYALCLTIYNFFFKTQHRLKLFYKNWFVFGFFGLVLIFWILRNLPFFPFNHLAPAS